jgi:hypothetical protein
MNPISFIITSPYYDSGMKSLGSKSIYTIKKNTILERQYSAIKKSCKNITHEIILVNNVDHNKTVKHIQNKKLDLKYVHLNKNNVNHAGCFLKGLELAKYQTVFNIECGLIMTHFAIADTIKNNKNCDINICCVGNRHKQNTDLQIGCITQNDNVSNVFFGLENKHIGINCINAKAKSFIMENFSIHKDKNKYVFEIINSCISQNLICKKTDIKSKDAYLVFNKKSLQQYTG